MYGGRGGSTAGFVCALLAVGLAPASAMAFEVKHTAHGLPVKWTATSVAYVVDASVSAAVPGGGDAVQAAASAWSGAAGAPALSTTVGPGGGAVGIDGQNTVLFAPDGFAPAGNALAVTVLSYEESTGAIVDADIVINGKHRFAVLSADARAGANVTPVSTEGSSDDQDGTGDGRPRFDLQHVAAHEVGHSLGMGDVREQQGPLMYAYTLPGDASVRAPETDDVDGLEQVYGGSAQRAGCGSASVAGGRSRPLDSWAALVLALAGAWTISRRRARVLLPVWPACAIVAVLAGGSEPAHSAPAAVPLAADALGDVVAVSTYESGGVFQTSLDVAPSSCRTGSCPAVAHVQAWGGTLGGITQQVGDRPVPRVGDRVAVAFAGHSFTAGTIPAIVGKGDGPEAVLVALVGEQP